MVHSDVRDDYDGKLSEIREKEYPNLPRAYLDNAASPMCANSLVQESTKMLTTKVLVNPHSNSRLSKETAQLIDDTRARVLSLLGVDYTEYDLVFTANSTAAIKLVGECIHERNFVYLKDSHTSIVGLRGLAKSWSVVNEIVPGNYPRGSVISWPMMSNFDGKIYPTQNWLDNALQSNALTLLDIAAYCSTSWPDFGKIKPDFATISFYKILGFPDLGGLLIRKSDSTREYFNHRQYAGGGTVAAITAGPSGLMVRNSDLVASLEDGTVPFHTIAMLGVAIREFERIFHSWEAISTHTQRIAGYCKSKLREISDCDLISDFDQPSPIIAFNLRSIGHNEFANAAAEVGIYVRAGTLCNIGAFSSRMNIPDSIIEENHRIYGKTCNDDVDILNGNHTGVIRISFGPYSSISDVNTLMEFIDKIRHVETIPEPGLQGSAAHVVGLFIYPVKSCRALQVTESQVFADGLKHDREFCLISTSTGKALSLKRHPKMALLAPRIVDQFLILTYGHKKVKLSMDCAQWKQRTYGNEPKNHVCSNLDAHLILNLDPEICSFLSDSIGTPCTIAKIAPGQTRFFKDQENHTLANSSPFLLINETSASQLGLSDVGVFRANIVLNMPRPWDEDDVQSIKIGSAIFDLIGACRRCNMVCVTSNGHTDPYPYIQLCKHRKIDGKLFFGRHMQARCLGADSVISLNDDVTLYH